MGFPYTFPFVFEGLTMVTGSDTGTGTDALKTFIQKAGSDIKLRGQQGQVYIPHKEVGL